jgi:hypothetical protein
MNAPQTTDSIGRPTPFLKLMRTEDAENLLLRFPNAFLLLTLIAWRARRAAGKCKWTGLEQGQAMVGDHDSCGLSRQKYRTAQANLQALGFATFKPTSKGTIATICNADAYDINADEDNHQSNHQITISQPSNNHQPTTNKNVKKDKKDKNEYLDTCCGGSAGTPPALENSQNRESGILKLEIEEKEVGDPIPLPPSPPPAKPPRKTPSKKAAFVPPSLEEVTAYVEGRVKDGNPRINAKKFFIHYDSNGWKVGRKQVDWKTKVKIWECDANGFGGASRAEPAKSTYVKPQPKVWTAEAAEAAKKEIMEHNRRVAASNPVKGELVW